MRFLWIAIFLFPLKTLASYGFNDAAYYYCLDVTNQKVSAWDRWFFSKRNSVMKTCLAEYNAPIEICTGEREVPITTYYKNIPMNDGETVIEYYDCP